MARVRFRLPIEVEVSREDLEAGKAIGKAVRTAKESGLLGMLVDVAQKTGDAVRRRTRREPPR